MKISILEIGTICERKIVGKFHLKLLLLTESYFCQLYRSVLMLVCA